VEDAIKEVRFEIGWAQAELGRRADVSQAWISMIEGGHAPNLSIDAADRLLSIMGARLVITVDAPFLGDRRRQRDPAHAKCVAHVAGRLRTAGWEVLTEVEVGGDRSRGWIDILAFDALTGVLLVIEIKTEIHDLGAIQRSLGWYEREAWAAASRAGWRPGRIIGALLLLSTAANEARAQANRDILGEAFPARARALADIVAHAPTPTDGRSDRAVAMIDPRSTRRLWLRPLRIDGRRSAAPYSDYAEFMRRQA
jgi:transcriptional regulator with XRE-family HTH domain